MLKNKEKDLLTSLIIGDGSISKDKKYNSYCLLVGHCEKQKDYCEWKMNLLNNSHIFSNDLKMHTRLTGKDKRYIQYFFNKRDFLLKYMYDRCIIDNKKNITNMLHLINSNRSVAIWFMDDGSVEKGRSKQKDGTFKMTKPSLKLCTHSFTYEEHIIMQKWFKCKFNIDCKIKTEVKRNRKNTPIYYYLKFNVENTYKIYSLFLKEYCICCDSMKDKFKYLIDYYS